MFNLPSCAGFSLTVTSTGETFPGAMNGTATAHPSGGTPPYSYLWNTLETTQTITSFIPGYYYVTVTDVNQCQKVSGVYVAPYGCNLSLTMSGNNSSSSSIYSGNGSATASVSGGNPPYNYLWNTGATTPTITNLPVGTYAVLVSEQSNPVCAVWGYYTVWGPSGVGANNIDYNNQITVYPNPGDGLINLNLTSVIREPFLIEVYNLLGEKVFNSSHSGKAFPIALNLTHLPSGNYTIRLTSTTTNATARFVKL